MRFFILTVVALTVLLGVASKAPVEAKGLQAAVFSLAVSSDHDQPPKLDVDINVNKGGSGGQWYANPVWIAIGGLALLVLLAFVFMAARGGTTVVK